ncbi:hypothetical protein IQ216_10355 [Cyanobium sp. LEGE 06143]|nr:hypothetical protein [Cyanobium sp. LEGE 06143]
MKSAKPTSDSPNVVHSEQIPTLDPLSGLVAQRLPKSTRVIVSDYDAIVLKGFAASLASRLHNHEIMLTWDSSKTPLKDFPTTLDLFYNGIAGQPYLAIKAGFSVFSNTQGSQLFLRLFKFFVLGPKQEPRKRRMFNFYYGDQLGLFYTAQTFRNHFQEFYSRITWEDYSASELVGNEAAAPKHFFYPKGGGSFSAIENVLNSSKLL